MSKAPKKGNLKGKKGKNAKQPVKDPTVPDEKTKEYPEIYGFGKFEFQNKIIYIGSYKQLKTGQKVREGYGKIIHPTSNNSLVGQEYYEGEWKNDKMNGYGIYHYSNGDVYEGDWVDDMQSGYGKYYFTDGNRYEGEWKDHKMHGAGKYLDMNNLGWGGEFRDGCFFSKEQAKLKEEKRLLKKIAKIKEIPFQFFKTWEDTCNNVDKKNINDMLSPFFAKNENMGLYFKGVEFPIYEDYKPEYWNSALRWAFAQPPKELTLNAARNVSKGKKVVKKAGASKEKDKKTEKPQEKKEEIPPYPKPNIEINVPKNGNDLIILSKESILAPQLQDDLGSGQVIEIRSILEDRTINMAISMNKDLGRWLIIYFNDNKAPEKEKRKPKPKPKGKTKGKSPAKKK